MPSAWWRMAPGWQGTPAGLRWRATGPARFGRGAARRGVGFARTTPQVDDQQPGQGKGAKMMSMLRGMLGWRARLGCVSGVLVAIAVSLGHGTSPAMAQREPPPSQAAMQYSFAPIVRKAAPAVVNVYVESTSRQVRLRCLRTPSFASSSAASSHPSGSGGRIRSAQA